MTDKSTFAIEALESGGFFVLGSAGEEFAATTLDEALRYIRKKLIPPDTDARQDYGATIGPPADWPRCFNAIIR